VGYKGPPDTAGSVEIAYSIAPSRQGQGFATEATSALIAWAFEHPACRVVIAPDTARANVASSRVLEKLGMQVYAATERAQSWRMERGWFKRAAASR
jgi:[ribosomal protein S5]-alanine N-acetyltransferase